MLKSSAYKNNDNMKILAKKDVKRATKILYNFWTQFRNSDHCADLKKEKDVCVMTVLNAVPTIFHPMDYF